MPVEVLRGAGYEVTPAADGQVAVDLRDVRRLWGTTRRRRGGREVKHPPRRANLLVGFRRVHSLGVIMRMLVCDDDASVGKLLHSIFATTGWQVDVVTSGRECIARMADSPPDVLVLDHMMPELTGIETARVLRDAGHTTPILLFSAYLGLDLQEAAEELRLMPVSKVDTGALVRMIEAFRETPAPAPAAEEGIPGLA